MLSEGIIFKTFPVLGSIIFEVLAVLMSIIMAISAATIFVAFYSCGETFAI